MTRTIFSGLAAAAMLAVLAGGSANAQSTPKPKPQPKAGTYSKTLTFTLSTTQPSKPGKGLKAKEK